MIRTSRAGITLAPTPGGAPGGPDCTGILGLALGRRRRGLRYSTKYTNDSTQLQVVRATFHRSVDLTWVDAVQAPSSYPTRAQSYLCRTFIQLCKPRQPVTMSRAAPDARMNLASAERRFDRLNWHTLAIQIIVAIVAHARVCPLPARPDEV